MRWRARPPWYQFWPCCPLVSARAPCWVQDQEKTTPVCCFSTACLWLSYPPLCASFEGNSPLFPLLHSSTNFWTSLISLSCTRWDKHRWPNRSIDCLAPQCPYGSWNLTFLQPRACYLSNLSPRPPPKCTFTEFYLLFSVYPPWYHTALLALCTFTRAIGIT